MKPPKNAIAKSVSNRSKNEKILQLVDGWNESIQKKLEELNVSSSLEHFVNGIILFVSILFQGIQERLSTCELFTNNDEFSSEKYVLKIGERYKI